MSHSAELFIGLISCIFILMIVFKLLGMSGAYAQEQQAQITAKNMQTAMNSVCVGPDGYSVEVKVNFPQQLNSAGENLLFSPFSDEPVKDAVRYMSTIRSYGDPWYIIYYENFPLGEEEGWEGWSEVAGTRIATVATLGIDQAMCLASVIPFTSVGKKLIKIGKKGLKATATGGGSLVLDYITKAAKTRKAAEHTGRIRKIMDSGITKLKKQEIFSSNIYRKMVASKNKITAPLDNIYVWFMTHSSVDLTKHVKASGNLNMLADDIPKVSLLDTTTGKLKKKLLKYSDDILVNGDTTNLGAKETAEKIKEIARGTDADHLLKDYSSEVADRMSGFKLAVQEPYYGFEPKEQKAITDLINKLDDLGTGGTSKITHEEVEHVTDILVKRGPNTLNEWDEYLSAVDSVSQIQGFEKRILKNIVPDSGSYLIDDTKPYKWTRGLLSTGDVPPNKLPRLGMALKHYAKVGVALEGKRTLTRWGSWMGLSYVFSKALSLADVSMLKFAPCSGNALCLKSQVNPSITVYPLDDCKDAGINYIELDKYAEGEEGIGVARWVDNTFGKGSTSKFYTASPCDGVMIIEKGECKCAGKQEPIVDETTLDTYVLTCKLSGTTNANCDVTKKMTYFEPVEEEELNPESFSANVVSEPIGGGDDKYRVEVDVGKWVWVMQGIEPTKASDASETEEGAVKCTKYILDLGEEFNCTFELPVFVGYATVCDGSNMWLECVNWTEGETKTGELPGLDGITEVEVTNWCCAQWNLTAYGGTYSGTTREIIRVGDCGEYSGTSWNMVIKPEIRINLKRAIEDLNSTGGNIWGIANPTTYYNSIEEDIVKAIKDNSETELRKGEDPNTAEINRLFMYNLEPSTTIPCLKVQYKNNPDTKGFCYTPPAGTETVKEAGWMGLSIIVDIGATAVTALVPGVGPAASGFLGCEAGNLVTYFGQDQISKEKEKNLWPNNAFFGRYYSKN